jgi:hypothetical protein
MGGIAAVTGVLTNLLSENGASVQRIGMKLQSIADIYIDKEAFIFIARVEWTLYYKSK